MACVCTEWHRAAAFISTSRRAAAVALVTASSEVPDAQLSAGQWFFRAAQRVLRGEDAFDGLQMGCPPWQYQYKEQEDCRGHFAQVINEDRQYLFFSRSIRELMLGLHVRQGRKGAYIVVDFHSPGGPQNAAWMQGFLLALTAGDHLGLEGVHVHLVEAAPLRISAFRRLSLVKPRSWPSSAEILVPVVKKLVRV